MTTVTIKPSARSNRLSNGVTSDAPTLRYSAASPNGGHGTDAHSSVRSPASSNATQHSTLPKMSIKGVGQADSKWAQQINAAKNVWGKLTTEELRKTEGHISKLSELVQERYSVTTSAAEHQVKNFFSNQSAKDAAPAKHDGASS